MKKVKVKTKQKQKQKQSQTVNINLGNVLKKSQPRRKTQPKQHNISQPISFNAPPIREYIDTSLSNQVSRLDNPLLARTTITNPIVEGSSPPQNQVGEIQNKFPLFQAQKKEVKITDEPQVAQGYLMEDLPQYIPQFNYSQGKKSPNQDDIAFKKSEIELKKAEAKRKSDEKKMEALRLKEEKKAEKIRLNEEKKAEKERKKQEESSKPKLDIGPSKSITIRPEPSSLIQTDISSFLNKPKPIDEKKNAYLENAASSPRIKNALISEPEEPTTITSAQIQEPPFVNVKPVVLMTPEGTIHKLNPPKKLKKIKQPNI